MLLPSPLTCDTVAPKTRYQASLFASPPLSPPASSSTTQTTITNIYSTCRALQSMLTTPTPLPSPPTRHIEAPSASSLSSSSPFRLRLRQRKPTEEPTSSSTTSSSSGVRKRIAKRAPAAAAAPRGVNKRRRALDDDMSRDTELSDESEAEETAMASSTVAQPSTPKRARLAPDVLPMGLERSDFHTLHLQQLDSAPPPLEGNILESVEGGGQQQKDSTSSSASASAAAAAAVTWSTEEDRILVELVLDKLKLSREEWQDCARSLGKDRGSVGKRWKSLISAGEVGLKSRSSGGRRAKLHGSWR